MNENQIRREILKILYDDERKSSVSFLDSKTLERNLNIDENDLRFNVNYLENKGYLKKEGFLGGDFIANISHKGIDLIENNEEFNTKFPLVNITNVNNSRGVSVNSNNVQIDVNDSINITDSFNKLYKQIDPSNDNANEIKENLKLIENELTKEAINQSTISNSVNWLKINAYWTIPMITQIITSVMMGNG